MKRKHDWSSLQNYLNVHERVLNHYSKFMDISRQYDQKRITTNYLLLECTGIIFNTYKGNKVRVDITKDVEIDDENPKRIRAQTVGYSYNANSPEVGNLLRYDSADHPSQLGPGSPPHHYFHHKHVWISGQEQVLKIEDDQWPHVDEFINEVLANY